MSTPRKALAVGGSSKTAQQSTKPRKFSMYISPQVLKALKIRAIQEDKSYSAIVEQAIETYLKTKP